MPQSAAITAAKNERARKDALARVLKKDGVEALFAELWRSTMGGLLDLTYPFEEELMARCRERIPEEWQREIALAVDAEEKEKMDA